MTQNTRGSNFISVLAWILIIGAGFASIMLILQNIMFFLAVPSEEMGQLLNDPQAKEDIPAFARFIFSHIHLALIAFLSVALMTVGTSVALLKRKNWARMITIVLMCLGIGWINFFTVFQNIMIQKEPIPAADTRMISVMNTFSLVFSALFTFLLGWIIFKLTAPKIKSEFIETIKTEEKIRGTIFRRKSLVWGGFLIYVVAMGVFIFGAQKVPLRDEKFEIAGLAASENTQKLTEILRDKPQLASLYNEKTKWAPIHAAACNGRVNNVRILIENGADINVRNCTGGTALHCSSECGYNDIVKVLLEAGANPNLEDAKGRTALDLALWENQSDTAEILKKYGAEAKILPIKSIDAGE